MLASNMDSYLCCRMGMRPEKESPSIPDGSSGKHLTLCLYNYDIVQSNGTVPWSFALQTTPTMPIGAVVQSPTGMKLNNMVYGAGVRASMSIAPQFTRQTIPNVVPGNIASVSDIYEASSFRIVSMRYKVIYTGPAVSAAGSFQAYASGLSIQHIGETSSTSTTPTPPTTGRYVRLYTPDGILYSYPRVGTDVFYVDGLKTFSNPFLSYPPSTATYRPEQQIVLVPRHRTGVYRSNSIRDTPIALTASSVLTGDTELNSWTATTGFSGTGWGSGVLGFDDDWESIILEGSGLNFDASFLIETCICVEIVPKAASAFYSLTRDAVNKPNVMSQVLKMAPNLQPTYSEM